MLTELIRNPRMRRNVEGYLFISPWLIGFVFLTLGPIIASAYLSLTEYSIISPPSFVGLANFKGIMADEHFWNSIRVTALYTLFSVPLGMIGSLAVAMLLNYPSRLAPIFRTVYYLPAVVSGVAVALLWVWIFEPDFGVLNYLLSLIGITGPAWLYDPTWVLPAFILMSLWGVGGNMVIYLAGLQGIPTQLYEAAQIDGAGAWKQFTNITLPMLSPVLFFNLVIGVINSFQVFTQSYVMTNGVGGPGDASLFYVLYLYQNAFKWFKMGYASALAWILFLIILVCTIVIFKTSGSWVYYEGQGRA
jgi:multiple sugar transport system permease protein